MTIAHSKSRLRALALLGAAMGAVILYLSIRGPSSFPDREDLEPVTGSISWTAPDRYSIRFAIAGDSRTFAYAHKSGERALVASVLADTSKHPVTVLIDPTDPQQGTENGPFFQVYEFRSSMTLLRSYAQVREAWFSDYRYGYLAALMAFVAAGFLGHAARKVPPNNSLKPSPLRGLDGGSYD